MPTATDLPGFLEIFKDRLREWMSGELDDKGRPTPIGPCQIKVAYIPQGQAAPMPGWDKLTVAGPDAIDVENIGDKIAAMVIDHVGANPSGHLQVRMWEDGKASKAGVDISRKLKALGEGGDSSVAMLKALVYRALDRADASDALMQAHSADVMEMNVEQGKTIGVLATARTAGSVGADSAGLWNVLGLAAFVVMLPSLKKALGLKPEASFDQVANRLRLQAESLMITEKAKPPGDAVGDGAKLFNATDDDGQALEGDAAKLQELAKDPRTMDLILQLAKAKDVDLVGMLEKALAIAPDPVPEPVK